WVAMIRPALGVRCGRRAAGSPLAEPPRWPRRRCTMRIPAAAIALWLALAAPIAGQESPSGAFGDDPDGGGTRAPRPVVTVEGTGRVRLAPDRAVLLAGVTAQ